MAEGVDIRAYSGDILLPVNGRVENIINRLEQFDDRYREMADVHTPEQRSYNMSRVKSKDTKPELTVRKFLHAHGFRYRLHDRKLPGKPDIVLPKYKTVIFVHGCFFHGHEGCRYFVIPKTRTEWWIDKINTNKQRDDTNCARLTIAGWHIITVYECELRPRTKEQTLQTLVDTLRNLTVVQSETVYR